MSATLAHLVPTRHPRESGGPGTLRDGSAALDPRFRVCEEIPARWQCSLRIMNVIPGWPTGPGPEPMNTDPSTICAGLCSWVPGSQAVPAPRNDDDLEFLHTLVRGDDGISGGWRGKNECGRQRCTGSGQT